MKIFIYALTFFSLINCSLEKKPDTKQVINADRWLELDLYYFDLKNIESSASGFFEKYTPMFDNVIGWKGLIINTGWVPEYIFQWKGNLNDTIPMPKTMQHWDWFDISGLLAGTTAERKVKWKERFEKGQSRDTVRYEPWTYNDLKRLITALKTEAVKQGIDSLRVGSMSVAWETIYSGEPMPFSKKHQEIYFKTKVWYEQTINLESKIHTDPVKYAAYPNGIPEGTPITEFIGKQWGDMSRNVGFEAIVFRDSYIGAAVYARKGPLGLAAPADSATVNNVTRATADLIRYTKSGNPNALIIGYSNGASTIGEWRVNCVDLEWIAKQGYLDAYIDQSWGACFSEPAMIKDGFWNKPNQGYTFQLGNILLHAAQLAETKTHHYVLINTWDAWESWDVLHTVPERVRWEIWAYHHAAVKTPKGLKMPAGSYISWCSRGKKTLSDIDIQFLTSNLNEAIVDAQNTKEVIGPTLVYNRDAMQWQSDNKPDKSVKEWIDEQAAGMMKWSVPVLSVTRLEYLPKVNSDMFILQSPSHLSVLNRDNILDLINSGKPMAIFASPAGGIDPDIASAIGMATKSKVLGTTVNYATKGLGLPELTTDIPDKFKLYHQFTENSLSADWQVVYHAGNSPALAITNKNNRKLLFWDPAEIEINLNKSFQMDWHTPMDSAYGSIYPYVLTARGVSYLLKSADLFSAENITPAKPLNVLAWKLADNRINVMVANLEEGINHSANLSFNAKINFPKEWFGKDGLKAINKWNKPDNAIILNQWIIDMPLAKSALYELVDNRSINSKIK